MPRINVIYARGSDRTMGDMVFFAIFAISCSENLFITNSNNKENEVKDDLSECVGAGVVVDGVGRCAASGVSASAV